MTSPIDYGILRDLAAFTGVSMLFVGYLIGDSKLPSWGKAALSSVALGLIWVIWLS